MFGFLRPDPIRRLEKRYAKLLEEARDLQRGGNMPAFAEKTAEAEAVGKELDDLRQAAQQG